MSDHEDPGVPDGMRPGRVLVLGADGLLGSHVVRCLLAQGWQVRVLLLPGSPAPTLQGLTIESVQGDLLGPVAALQRAVDGCSHVIHAAAVTDMWAPAETTWRVNYEGTRRVVRACLAARVRRLVFVGSASSFAAGGLETPGDEGSPFPAFARQIPYMASKYRAMRLVLRAVRDKGLNAVVVAPTFMLGDHDARPSSGELICQFVRRGLLAVSPGGRNFSSASDVAEATVAALHRGPAGAVYILGGHNLSYRDFFGHVARLAQVRAPVATAPRPALWLAGAGGSAWSRISRRPAALNLTIARLASLETYYDGRRAQVELGMPQTPIDTAIAASLAGLRRHGHLA